MNIFVLAIIAIAIIIIFGVYISYHKNKLLFGEIRDEKLIANLKKMPSKQRSRVNESVNDWVKEFKHDLEMKAKFTGTSINSQFIHKELSGYRWIEKPIPELSRPGLEIMNAVYGVTIAIVIINSFKYDAFREEADLMRLVRNFYYEVEGDNLGKVVYHPLFDRLFENYIRERYNLNIILPSGILGINMDIDKYDKNAGDKYAKVDYVYERNIHLVSDAQVYSALIKQLMNIS